MKQNKYSIFWMLIHNCTYLLNSESETTHVTTASQLHQAIETMAQKSTVFSLFSSLFSILFSLIFTLTLVASNAVIQILVHSAHHSAHQFHFSILSALIFPLTGGIKSCCPNPISVSPTPIPCRREPKAANTRPVGI